jgi:uncharacterized integral membrane protein
MKYIKIILFAIVLLILVVFAHYNQAPTTLVFLSYGGVTYHSYELPLFAFFYIAILITIIVMSLLEVIERTSLSMKNRKLQKENTKLRAELAAGPQTETLQTGNSDTPAPTDAQEKKKAPATTKKKK